MQAIIIYLFIINAVSFILMLTDKYNARKNLCRISEATLIGAAAIGGSLGALAGMYLARHKTKHFKFTLGIPLLLFVHILLGLQLMLR